MNQSLRWLLTRTNNTLGTDDRYSKCCCQETLLDSLKADFVNVFEKPC